MKRNNKNNYIVLILFLVIGITIGYAVINQTIFINGKSNISKNSWNVHFDNIVVKDGSIEAVKIPTIENETAINFEVTLNLPGDFYEFTVDVVNSGTINAMIENIEKTADLTPQQSKYLNYIIQYENGEEITTKQIVNSNESIKLKVRVEYKKDITSADLPANAETINFGFNVLYVQSNDPGVGGTSRPEEIITDMYYYSDITTALAAVTAGTVEDSVNADETSGTIGVYTSNVTGKLTMRLLSDISINEILNIESDLILDLNGKSITTTITPAIRINSPNVIINGTDEGSAITVNAPATQKGTVLSVMSGKLTVEGGTYTANTAKAGTSTNQTQCLYAYNNTTLHVKNADIYTTDTNNGSANGVTGKDGSNIIIENSKILVKSGVSLENRGVSSTGNVTLRNSDIRSIADYVANAAGNNYASNSRGVWCSGHLIMENCYVDGSHAGVTVQGTVYVNGGTYNGYGHGGIYLAGTAGPHYFYNAEFNWAPMQEGSVSDEIAGTNGAGFYIGGASNQTAYFDNCKFNMIDANGETYKGNVLPFYGMVLRTSGGEKNTTIYISNSYVEEAKYQMFRGNGTSGHLVYNGIGNDWSKSAAVHKGTTDSFIDTGISYAAS